MRHACMCTNFDGHRLSSFGDIATFKNGQISLSDHGLYSPWSSKILINRNRLKRFIQVGINETCMCTNFDGHRLSSFGDIATFKNNQISLSDHGLCSPWSSKNLINQNRPKKFMQVGIDVTCMYTEFGGRGLSGFGDTATLKKQPNFPFGPWAIVHGHQKI